MPNEDLFDTDDENASELADQIDVMIGEWREKKADSETILNELEDLVSNFF